MAARAGLIARISGNQHRQPTTALSRKALEKGSLRRALSLLCLALSSLCLAGCPWCGFGSIREGNLESHQVEELRARLHPYDLTAELCTTLQELDRALASSHSGFIADAHRMRAEAHLDLWTYGLLSMVHSPSSVNLALDCLAERVQWGGDSENGLQGEEALRRVAEALADWVTEDLRAAGESSATITTGSALLRFAVWEPQVSRETIELLRSSRGGQRARLLLLAWLYQKNGPWNGHSVLELESSFLEEVGWLCADAESDTLDQLATQCGYQCAHLPIPTPRHQEPERQVLYREIEDEVLEREDDLELDTNVLNQQPDSLWFRTPGDLGYELVQACGPDYFGLPAGGGMILLDQAIFLDLLFLSFLGELLAELEEDLSRGEPLSLLSAEVIDQMARILLSKSTPVHFTSAVYQFDPRLELPRVRLPIAADGTTRVSPLTNLPERIVSVLSDGVYLAQRPRLQLTSEGGYQVVHAEAADGYRYPGLRAVEFSPINRLDSNALVDGRDPRFANALDGLEEALTLMAPTEEASENSLALLVDGSTRLETALVLMSTLLDKGYSSLHPLVLDRSSAEPLVLHMDWLEEAGQNARLRLAADEWSLFLPGSSAGNEPGERSELLFGIENRERQPYSSLYRQVAEAIEQGRLGERLAIEISDRRLDWGTLVRLLEVLSYWRDLSGSFDDRQLLEAQPLLLDGSPRLLFEGGVWVVLGLSS